MEVLSFRCTCYGLVLLCALWSVTHCQISTSTTTPEVTSETNPTTTEPATSKPPLEDVKNVDVFNQTTTSVTIEFDQVVGVSQYGLHLDGIFKEDINATDPGPVTHIVDELSPARKYNMTLYSIKDTQQSEGFLFNSSTAPENVDKFTKVNQTNSSITLEWEKKNGVPLYFLEFGGNNRTFTEDGPFEYTVENLNSATTFTFTMYCEFEGIRSTGVRLTASTAPSQAEEFRKTNQNETSITLQWENAHPHISYSLQCNGEEPINFNSTDLGNPATYEVPGLQNTTVYIFTLTTVFDNIRGNSVSLRAATAPRNAEGFKAVNPSETSMTLQWEPVPGVSGYILKSVYVNLTITGTNKATFHNLESGILHSFTLFTEFEGLQSSGIRQTAPTVPPQVSSVNVVERNLNAIKLEWKSQRDDWEYELLINGKTVPLKPTAGSVSHMVDSLKAGTVYPFNISTVFSKLKSTLYQNSTVTVIDCAKVKWNVTETSIEGVVDGEFTSAAASNGSQPQLNSGSGKEVKFSGLYPGAKYDMKLMYNELQQCQHSLNIVPPGLTAYCKNCQSGYSLCVEWDRPSGVWDYVQITVSGQAYNVGLKGELNAELPGYQPAQTYQAWISTQSGTEKSEEKSFSCATDARGVIAGSFFGVLLFLILLCAVIFVMLRRPDLIRRNKLPKAGLKTSVRKNKGVPLERFPAYFDEMSADENKGFSLEYENLSYVGTDQSQKAATAPENKGKNRFVNVLPYDRSRVKLTSSSPHKDYINASYMPGYNSDREFIAAQGPTPSTVADFWRMIWEQGVRGVVMVTNCTEGGRTKCEQYWADSDARVCGDLAVFTTSQKKDVNWTLREFTVKHRITSEERSVKHFHFTAWPDHGVPEGTGVLIQFRALVRQHMQTAAQGTSTVVHCSAGVGRTGTLIALDTLLQQMEREKKVDVNGFVHKMRMNRPHMVQTESQYVFLHQCVLDRLRLNEKQEENIYENELIYANATALREYQNNMNNV